MQGIWVSAYVRQRGKMGRVLEISGTIPNIKMASYVHDFVRHFIHSQWAAYNRDRRLNRHRQTDFAVGIIEGFRSKLEGQKKEKEKKEAEKRANMEAQRGFEGGPGQGMMEMTPEMRQQFQNMRGNMQPGQGRTMDTAAIRRFQQMRGDMPQGGQRDTAAMRRFQQNRQNQGQTQPAQQPQQTP